MGSTRYEFRLFPYLGTSLLRSLESQAWFGVGANVSKLKLFPGVAGFLGFVSISLSEFIV